VNYNKLKELLSEKKITVAQLAEKIGMSKGGLYSAISNETLSVNMLEKISEVLEVPATYFFDGGILSVEELNNLLNEAHDEARKQELHTDLLWERIGEKRYLLRMIYSALKSIYIDQKTIGELTVGEVDKMLRKLIDAIDRSENFESEPAYLKNPERRKVKKREERQKKD